MGVLPLQLPEGVSAQSLGLDGTESFDTPAIELEGAALPVRAQVSATHPSGRVTSFEVIVRVDTPTEALYLRHGGILQYMVRKMAGIA